MTFTPVQGRPRTALSIVLGVVALALSLVGFVGAMPAAHASDIVIVEGRGAELSQSFTLPAGKYRVDLSYSGNNGSGATQFVAALRDPVGKFSVQLADGIAAANSVSTSVTLTAAATLLVDVTVADQDALWKVSLTKLPPVPLKFTTTPTPKISGTAKVGRTLKAVPGTWKPSGVKLSYRWYRGSSKISGATRSSYKLTSKDKGKTIKVTVTGTRTGYVTVVKTSKSTSKVKS